MTIASVIALSVLGIGTSCRTPPLPTADFSAPGWLVQQGQAVWKPAKNKPELAGELLVATNVNGDFLVQFAKVPFPLATAQWADPHWEIEFGSGDYQRTGRGQPPARFVWFQLPRALAGVGLDRNWRSERVASNAWNFSNRRTGEKLECEFFP